jgi:hypothetical protein
MKDTSSLAIEERLIDSLSVYEEVQVAKHGKK